MAATDPLVQAMDIAGGVQPEGFSTSRSFVHMELI